MDDFPRRRRLQPQEPKRGGGIPIFPLIVLVVFAGLLLGGALAKFLNRGAVATPAPTFTPLPAEQPTPTFAPRATPHRAASPSVSSTISPSPSLSPSPSPSSSPSASPSATPRPSPSEKASPKPTAPSVIYITPQPKASVTKMPATKMETARTPTPAPAATPTATPVLITGPATSDHAAAIVRAYLAAVLRGDEATAAGYLSRGLPNESFYTGAAKITDMETTHNADGTYTVAVDITSPGGEYYETFKLAEGAGGLGLQITYHYAIKVN